MINKDEKFKVLLKKEIYELLNGDGPVLAKYNENEYRLPYYTTAQLEKMCTDFGVTENVCGSRWCYMEALLEYAIEHQRCDELLRYLFNESQFTNLQDIDDIKDIDEVYKQIVEGAIVQINHIIRLSKNELALINNHFFILETGKKTIIETPKLNIMSNSYVQGLRERCKDDFYSGNYDSVITKSRTLIEEILVQILEENEVEEIPKGDLTRLYNQFKTHYNMQQSSDKDRRVNSLLSGLEKIVKSITEMRNANSDAHGVGSRRIAIREYEARLVMNSAITFCEYIISIRR